MMPDYNRAAILAAKTLIDYKVTAAPVDPMPILKQLKGVLLFSYAEVSECIGIDRENIVKLFGKENQDAVTSVQRVNGELRYIVAYNKKLPFYLLQRALARELGHIILGHDGSLPEDVQNEESACFARHFLCPRALVRSIFDSDALLTVTVLGNLTGCDETCLAGMRATPGTDVPADLNDKIRERFAEYVKNFVDYHEILQDADKTKIANFGSYMDGYEDDFSCQG